MKMRSYNFFHTNTKNPGNNLGIFCLITGRPKLNGYLFFALFINRTKSFHYQKFCFSRLSYISCKIQTFADNISTKTTIFASPTPPIDKKVSINVM